jgi:hypothetical protein
LRERYYFNADMPLQLLFYHWTDTTRRPRH